MNIQVGEHNIHYYSRGYEQRDFDVLVQGETGTDPYLTHLMPKKNVIPLSAYERIRSARKSTGMFS